ncbi:MAG TPA: FkbM family methyltransferase [Candidatus Angelobacter sp.]|nr:FkbM family methyltransferase [Candidatus Angelobacter sp.]
MSVPVTNMSGAEGRTLASRLRIFWNRPWHEKILVAGYRIKMSFPGFPVPMRLPFGAWWLIQDNAIDHALLAGRFETAELRFTERLLQPGMTVLDIGANHGLYTLLASRCVGSRGRVFAFEPSPRECKRLRTHTWLNRCTNVSVQACALGNETTEACLYVVEGSQTGCNSLRPPIANTGTSPQNVRVNRLDDWLREHKIERVEFIKLDVEGAELEVLRGARELLERRPRPVILAEVQDLRTQPWGYPAKEIIDFLRDRGYQWFSLSPEGLLEPLDVSRKTFDGNFVACPEESAASLQRDSLAALPATSPSDVQAGTATRQSTMCELDPDSPEFRRILSQHWYYSMELRPGLYTRGDEHANVICTRELLARLSPVGLDVCDVGTMEGMIPVLLKRRGARSVVALDAIDCTEKIRLVQLCTGESFEYVPRVSLPRVKEALSERARLSGYSTEWNQTKIQTGFDVVVLSGVLYHVFSPFHVIGLARTLLKRGGLLILETAASCQDRYAQNWVFRGDKWIYPGGTDTWFLTLRLLDHFLRFMKFKPVDCVHGPIYEDIVRVAVAAAAVDNPLPLKAESEWFLKSTTNIDYNEIVDTEWARSSPAEIPYSPGVCLYHPELSGAVDIHRTVKEHPGLPDDRNKIILRLGDKK